MYYDLNDDLLKEKISWLASRLESRDAIVRYFVALGHTRVWAEEKIDWACSTEEVEKELNKSFVSNLESWRKG